MKQKIPVAILGATGAVGQMFVSLLEEHPWFEVAALAASERSAGKKYGEAVNWILNRPIPQKIAEMTLVDCKPPLNCALCFSGLDSSVAGELETAFAQAGSIVISNSKNHRMDPDVPLLIPEVNSGQLALVKQQKGKGMIITNPNCSVIGLAMALKPLDLLFGVEDVHVVTLQAISGAGFPGVASLNIIDNVIPFIGGEEEKVESEPQKIMATLGKGGLLIPHPMRISAQCTRVAVIDGHTACVSVKLKKKGTEKALIAAWEEFTAEPQQLKLPSAPEKPLVYCRGEAHPQPRRQRDLGNGMSVSIGRLRPCPLFDWKFVLLSHNTIRGAAGGAILNAELLIRSPYWSGNG